MKKAFFLLLFLSLSTGLAFCQNDKDWSILTVEEAFKPRMPEKMDTLYFQFYDGVQMIEVDQIGYWDRKIFFLEQSEPRAMPHSMFHPMPIGNEYFFRDTTGTIVKAFNSKLTLNELTKHFKKIPIDKRSSGFAGLFPYHSNQAYRTDGVWYQSPQPMFNFAGLYRVSSGYAEQTSTIYGSTDFGDAQGFKFGLIDSLGNQVIPIEYNFIYPFKENLIVQKDAKLGVINYDNEVVVSLVYDNFEVDRYSNPDNQNEMGNVFFLTLIESDSYNQKYSYDALYLTKENKLLTLNNYTEVYHEHAWISQDNKSKRFLYVSKNGKRGLLNEHYQEIIPPEYEILEFNWRRQDPYRMARDGKFGFWGTDFKEVIPLEYDYVENFSEDSTALVLKDGAYYRIDTQNKKQSSGELNPAWKIYPLSFVSDKNYMSVQTSDVYGIVDISTNEMILPFTYKSLIPNKINDFFAKNKASLKKNKIEMGSTPDMIDEILFRNNKIIVKNQKDQYGVIDTAFNVLIDFEYDNLEPMPTFLDYLTYLKDGKRGAIDYAGEDMLPDDYEEVRYDIHYEQERDIFKVKKEGKWGVVNFENETVLPCMYDSIRFLGHWNRPKVKLWAVQKNNRFGVVDENNKTFVPFQYDWISHLEGNNLWINNKYGERVRVNLRN